MMSSRRARRCQRPRWRPALLPTLLAAAALAGEPATPALPMRVPVLVVRYFPVNGDRIDQAVTGDWGEPLAQTRNKTEQLTREVVAALEQGSNEEQMTEAVHVAAAIRGGASLVHGVQMRNHLERLGM